MKPIALIITGPTASGKSAIGTEIAKAINGEIVCSDSVQIYKNIPLLSSSPQNTQKIAHHLYQIIDGDVHFSVMNWLLLAKKTINEISKRKNIPIILGGSPMYQRLLIDGISSSNKKNEKIPDRIENLIKRAGNERAYNYLKTIDPTIEKYIRSSDTYRIIRSITDLFETKLTHQERMQIPKITFLDNFNVIKICILPPRTEVYQNCKTRFISIIENGGIEEVEQLQMQNINQNMPISKAIGVNEITRYLKKEISKEKLIELASQRTRNYAKMQYTWFNNKFSDFVFFKEMGTDETVSKILKLVLSKIHNQKS